MDTLEFLKAGGRCSSLVSFGAGLLKIKPCIEVDNSCGSMHIGKKYRGNIEKVFSAYTDDILSNIDSMKKDDIFVVHSGIPQKLLDMVYDKVKDTNKFSNVYISRASCTISSHCGPNTMGIMYINK